MSVTFYPDAIKYAKQDVPCYCNGDDLECYDCNGTGYWQEDVPAEGFIEMNVANSNAGMLLRIVLPEIQYDDLCGHWDSKMLDRVSINIIKLLNKDTSYLCSEDEQIGNIYLQGVSAERLENYLRTLLAIIHCCRKYGCNLNFA